ncbi:MAG TPA: tetratricopeptide repeat protein [Gemmatimonadaceae bacterium]|nr:tetratricopeptide repeat protein [Gemmatimonadaceae bacterium]
MTNFWRRYSELAIALLALASSAVSIVNWFTYDDRYVIELNPTMAAGLHHLWRVFAEPYWPRLYGGDGYRPLTILAFRLQDVFGGGIPLAFHAVNILLYAIVSVMVFVLAKRILPFWAAWLTGALFAVHPVHVEAVANVVGQSELWVAFFMVPAITLYLRDRMRGTLEARTIAAILVLYAAACFSKEHGVVLPAILAAAEVLFVREEHGSLRSRIAALRPFYLALAAIAIAFIAVRAVVLSDHGIGGFQPFTPFSSLHITTRDRILTAVTVVPQWVRLLLWPSHLAAEWGPPGIEIAQGFSITQIPGALLLVAVLGLALALWRTRPVISFGVAVLVAALLPSSNFILPAGIVLAERTLFLPSVGAMLVVGGALEWIADAARARGTDMRRLTRLAATASALVLVAGAAKSWTRSEVWRDNDTLFANTVRDVPDSYRAHFMYGAWLFSEKKLRLGEEQYHRALALFPYDPSLSFNLAEEYRSLGLCGPAVPLYKWTYAVDPQFPMGHTEFSWCLLSLGRYAEAKQQALIAVHGGGELPRLRGMIYSADSAIAADARKAAGRSVALAGTPSKVPESVQKTARKTRGGAASPRGKLLQ